MKRLLGLLLFLFPLLAMAQMPPIYRQFFTTNTAPVVEVVAGSNATVVASTPNAFTRRFTVSSPGIAGSNSYNGSFTGNGSGLTNISATNIVGASYYPYNLNGNATGTNLFISPTNGPLQVYTFTNTAYATVLSWDTNYTETIRLELRGSNTLTWATANLSNSVAMGPSNTLSVIILDKASGTNLWWGYRLR